MSAYPCLVLKKSKKVANIKTHPPAPSPQLIVSEMRGLTISYIRILVTSLKKMS